jgi:hypothetical protein
VLHVASYNAEACALYTSCNFSRLRKHLRFYSLNSDRSPIPNQITFDGYLYARPLVVVSPPAATWSWLRSGWAALASLPMVECFGIREDTALSSSLRAQNRDWDDEGHCRYSAHGHHSTGEHVEGLFGVHPGPLQRNVPAGSQGAVVVLDQGPCRPQGSVNASCAHKVCRTLAGPHRLEDGGGGEGATEVTDHRDVEAGHTWAPLVTSSSWVGPEAAVVRSQGGWGRTGRRSGNEAAEDAASACTRSHHRAEEKGESPHEQFGMCGLGHDGAWQQPRASASSSDGGLTALIHSDDSPESGLKGFDSQRTAETEHAGSVGYTPQCINRGARGHARDERDGVGAVRIGPWDEEAGREYGSRGAAFGLDAAENVEASLESDTMAWFRWLFGRPDAYVLSGPRG